MGSFGSREVVTQTRDFAVPLMKLTMNFCFLGFALGILIHNNDSNEEYTQYLSLLGYAKIFYFYWFILSWYVVYVGIYLLIIEALVRPFLFAMVGYRRELQGELLVEIIYGLWACGQVLGSWRDWHMETDCIKSHDCRGYFMQNIIRMMESTCEYFTAYEFDAVRRAYVLKGDGMCYCIFHAVPTFLMTALSTLLAYIIVFLLGYKL